MQSDLNLPIEKLSKSHLRNIKLLCFDGDGVTKKRGTEFINENGVTTLRSFEPTARMKGLLMELSKHYHVTISSGRSLSYLQEIYNEELMGKNGSLIAENGMFLWWQARVFQNFEVNPKQKEKLEAIRAELEKLDKPNIKGFEPKEYMVTLHADGEIPEVPQIVKKNDPENELYCWWNDEAYDIGLKTVNKGTGLKKLVEKLGIKMENVLTVGNGINDENMTDVVGLDISTDPKHLKADFAVWGEEEGGIKVIERILHLVSDK